METSVATAEIPASFRHALLLCVGFAAFTAWDQSHWWRLKEDYAFGWLAPVFAGYIVWDRWPRILAALRDDVRGKTGTPVSRGTALAGLLALGGSVAFLLGALLRAAAGPSYPASLALAVGTGAVVLGVIAFSTRIPATGTEAAGSADARARATLVGLFVFPALVWLVSAPLVSVVENALSLLLMNKITTAVFFVFEVLGQPVEQQGNVLLLPTGQVGVAEACSGIRSLMGCLFAGAFLGAVFFDRPWKKVALVVAAAGFAFLTNLMRSLFLTAWAYRYGPAAMEGRVHDLTTYAVLVLTALGLLTLVPLFNLKVKLGFAGKVEPETLR